MSTMHAWKTSRQESEVSHGKQGTILDDISTSPPIIAWQRGFMTKQWLINNPLRQNLALQRLINMLHASPVRE